MIIALLIMIGPLIVSLVCKGKISNEQLIRMYDCIMCSIIILIVTMIIFCIIYDTGGVI